ncbi:MAG: radical SAM protein [Lentisphaeria bacterium]|nr:radical SAM protein [Lentisphaeria bacterium]
MTTMNPLVPLRIMHGCSFRSQWNLLRFCWNGNGAIRAFERRLKKGEPFFPAFIMMSITNRCNLHCKGCWVEQTKPPMMLSLKQVQGIVDTARKYDSQFFGLLGGEPLLHPDVMTLIENNPQAYFQLFTNGTLLNDDICARFAKLGNVTLLISIEGMETESRLRRGRDDVFAKSIAGLEAAVKAKLFTGVAASINRNNYDELVSTEYLDFLVKKGVHYIWYYIYRPCGSSPEPERALDAEQIVSLRRFIVEQRRTAKLMIIDAYWDADGNAVCPGAMGLSHHIAPNGAVEFCPIVQSTGDYLNEDASNLEEIFQKNPYLKQLRHFSVQNGRNCLPMEAPHELKAFLSEQKASDSSNRNYLQELAAAAPLPCHHVPGQELPEKSLAYRWGKRHYFFGFGAYG